MERAILRVVFACGLTILLVWNAVSVSGQSQPGTIPKITINDKALVRNLAAYCRNAPYEVISVGVDKLDDTYEYYVSSINFSDELEQYPPRFWGLWRNRLVVFYGGPDVKNMVSVDQPADIKNLVQYAQSLLPSTHGHIILTHGLEWKFAIRDGREEWLWTSDGYDSRDFPQPE